MCFVASKRANFIGVQPKNGNKANIDSYKQEMKELRSAASYSSAASRPAQAAQPSQRSVDSAPEPKPLAAYDLKYATQDFPDPEMEELLLDEPILEHIPETGETLTLFENDDDVFHVES